MTHTATAIKFKHEIFVTQFQSFKRLKQYTYKNVYVMVLSLNFAKMQGLLPIILIHQKAFVKDISKELIRFILTCRSCRKQLI